MFSVNQDVYRVILGSRTERGGRLGDKVFTFKVQVFDSSQGSRCKASDLWFWNYESLAPMLETAPQLAKIRQDALDQYLLT